MRPSGIRGIGALGFDVGGSPDWRIDANGQYVDCNAFISGLFNSVCWGVGGYQGTNPANVTGITPPPVDCSQFANLANSQCSIGDYLGSNVINLPVILMGALVIIFLIKR